jgi:hypothetical protein
MKRAHLDRPARSARVASPRHRQLMTRRSATSARAPPHGDRREHATPERAQGVCLTHADPDRRGQVALRSRASRRRTRHGIGQVPRCAWRTNRNPLAVPATHPSEMTRPARATWSRSRPPIAVPPANDATMANVSGRWHGHSTNDPKIHQRPRRSVTGDEGVTTEARPPSWASVTGSDPIPPGHGPVHSDRARRSTTPTCRLEAPRGADDRGRCWRVHRSSAHRTRRQAGVVGFRSGDSFPNGGRSVGRWVADITGEAKAPPDV